MCISVNGGYSLSLFWPSPHHRPRHHRQRRKLKTSPEHFSSLNSVSSGETVGSSCVQTDTVTDCLPTSSTLKAHFGIKQQALRQTINNWWQLKIMTMKRLVLPPVSLQWKNSQVFDSEVAANQTCLNPTTNSDSEGEEINLKSCIMRVGTVFMGC